MKRLAGATGLVLAVSAASGVFLVSDEGEAPTLRLGLRVRTVAEVATRKPVVVTGPEALRPAPVAPASSDPRDLARELPEPAAAGELAAMLCDPDTDVAVAAAEALGKTPEGRPILVAHLARPVDSPGLDHLACLEALAEFGRVEDLRTILPWAEREDAVGDLAGWCVRTICDRERVDVPEGLRDAVPELDAEVRSGAGA